MEIQSDEYGVRKNSKKHLRCKDSNRLLTLQRKVIYNLGVWSQIVINRIKLTAATASLLTACACSDSNNLLLGHVAAQVGSHRVAVTDCYRTEVPVPERLTGTGFREAYRFVPCKDAVVEIKDEILRVNDRDYGRMHPGAGILVDHGVVSVQ